MWYLDPEEKVDLCGVVPLGETIEGFRKRKKHTDQETLQKHITKCDFLWYLDHEKKVNQCGVVPPGETMEGFRKRKRHRPGNIVKTRCKIRFFEVFGPRKKRFTMWGGAPRGDYRGV